MKQSNTNQPKRKTESPLKLIADEFKQTFESDPRETSKKRTLAYFSK